MFLSSDKLKDLFNYTKNSEYKTNGNDPYQNNLNRQSLSNSIHNIHKDENLHDANEEYDPFLEQFERMFKSMQSAFIRNNIEFDEEDNPIFGFFNGTGLGNSHHDFDEHLRNPHHNHDRFIEDDERRFRSGSDYNYNYNFQNNSYKNPESENENKNIKYSQNKIYDV